MGDTNCAQGTQALLPRGPVEPQSVELIDYRQACDDKGMAMVTSAAMALM